MIYFLLNDDNLVYIGKTTRLKERIYEHRLKDFNEYATATTSDDDLREYELIEYHKPKLNKRKLSIGKHLKLLNAL